MTDEERLELFFFMLELIDEINRLWEFEAGPTSYPDTIRMH
jgi:hypothetical protein